MPVTQLPVTQDVLVADLTRQLKIERDRTRAMRLVLDGIHECTRCESCKEAARAALHLDDRQIARITNRAH